MNKIIGLDVGDRQIGVAICDDLKMTAQGFGTINRNSDRKALHELKKIIKEKNVSLVVAGLPFHTKSRKHKTQQAEKVQVFVNKLKKETPISVVYQDERFTTRGAIRLLEEAGIKGKKIRQLTDKVSAQLILQMYLNKL